MARRAEDICKTQIGNLAVDLAVAVSRAETAEEALVLLQKENEELKKELAELKKPQEK
jgi:hypothetical protein